MLLRLWWSDKTSCHKWDDSTRKKLNIVQKMGTNQLHACKTSWGVPIFETPQVWDTPVLQMTNVAAEIAG